jgi:hypothetical protein
MSLVHPDDGAQNEALEALRLRHWGRDKEPFPITSGNFGGHTANYIHGGELHGLGGYDLLIRPLYEEVDAILTSQLLTGDRSGICVYGQRGSG